MGLFSSSKTSQAVTNVDRRVAVQDGVGISGDGNSLSLTSNTNNLMTDHGAIAAGAGIANGALQTLASTNARAFDSIDKSNALVGQSFDGLLSAADSLWQRGETLIGQTQQHVADAWQQANTDGKGTIDNKTIVVLAVAAAAAIAFMARRGN